jgi:hypothetical protein
MPSKMPATRKVINVRNGALIAVMIMPWVTTFGHFSGSPAPRYCAASAFAYESRPIKKQNEKKDATPPPNAAAMCTGSICDMK